MEHDPRGFLYDVLKSADAISRFLDDVSEQEYLANEMLRAAVERQFEIIGEALARLAKNSPEVAARIPELAGAVALRNMLIHGYRVVDSQTVWRIAQENLLPLRDRVASLLAELEDGGQ
jgi:uncharacterized protein with HEPN domain